MAPFWIACWTGAVAFVAFVLHQSGWLSTIAGKLSGMAQGNSSKDWLATKKPPTLVREYIVDVKRRTGCDDAFAIEAARELWSPAEAMEEFIRRQRKAQEAAQ